MTFSTCCQVRLQLLAQVKQREAAAKAAAAELATLNRQLGARKLDAQELQVRRGPPFFLPDIMPWTACG